MVSPPLSICRKLPRLPRTTARDFLRGRDAPATAGGTPAPQHRHSGLTIPRARAPSAPTCAPTSLPLLRSPPSSRLGQRIKPGPAIILRSAPLGVDPTPLLEAEQSRVERTLIPERFWPGPLTIIVRAGGKLPLRSTANTGNVALRVPDAAIPRAVVERFGLPITATSANLQGASECTRATCVRDQIGDRIPLIIDGGPTGRTPAHHDRRSFAGAGTLGDSARGRDPNARDCDGAAEVRGVSGGRDQRSGKSGRAAENC